ncbi:MAG: hypothetical protein ACK4GG_00340 [Sphingomonas sp.]
MLGLTIAMLLMPPQVGEFGARQQDMQKASSRTAAIELANYADCVVADRSGAEAVERFLREYPQDRTESASGKTATNPDCMNESARRYPSTVMLHLSWGSFRAALYPALYRRDFGRSGPPAGIAALEPLSLAPEFDRDPATLPSAYRPRRALGDCVARQAPQDTHALLTAVPHGKAEDAAIAALGLPLAKCLPKGETFRLNRATLRAVVGEAMYKLALAARARTPVAP